MQFFAQVLLFAFGCCFSYRQTEWSSFMIMMAVTQSRRNSIWRMTVAVGHKTICRRRNDFACASSAVWWGSVDSSFPLSILFWCLERNPRGPFLRLIWQWKKIHHYTRPARERTLEMVIVDSIGHEFTAQQRTLVWKLILQKIQNVFHYTMSVPTFVTAT